MCARRGSRFTASAEAVGDESALPAEVFMRAWVPISRFIAECRAAEETLRRARAERARLLRAKRRLLRRPAGRTALRWFRRRAHEEGEPGS